MDPVTMAIVGALSAGVVDSAGQVGEHVLADAYTGLKAVLIRKFGTQSEVAKAVEGVETRPESVSRQGTLGEEIAAIKADQDPEVRQAAQALLEQIDGYAADAGHVQHAVGNYIAQADRGSTASVRVSQPKE